MAKGRRGYEQAGIHYGSGHATSSMALPSVTASRPEGEEKAAQIKDGTSRSRRETLAALRSVRGVSSADILLLLLLFLAVVRFLRACSRFSPVRVKALAFCVFVGRGLRVLPGLLVVDRTCSVPPQRWVYITFLFCACVFHWL